MYRKYLDDLRTFPADAALAWRQRGFAGLRDELAERTVYRLLRWGRVMVIEQDLERFRDVPPPTGVTIEPFDGHWSQLAELATQRQLQRFRHAAANGRICLVARRNGRPIGYTWHSDTMDPRIEAHDIPLPPDAGYGWDLYVVPSERGSGTGTALVAARLRLARERGFRKGWRMVSPKNQPSLRTAEKTAGYGQRHVATLSYLKLGARTFTRYRLADDDAGRASG